MGLVEQSAPLPIPALSAAPDARRRRTSRIGFGLWLALTAMAPASCAHAALHAPDADHRSARQRNAIALATRLVPERHSAYEIVVVDPDLSGDPAAVRRVDAFTVVERDGSRRRKIYLNGESDILAEAARGSNLYVKVLAAVIVHESLHIEGASETEARHQEAEFFESLIGMGLVAEREGREYLTMLRLRDRVAQQ